MKTLQGWNEARINLDKYLTEPVEIDEDLALYIGECVAPYYVSQEFIQGGDPIRSIESIEDGRIMVYATVSIIGDRYFYLGKLPEFKQ